MNRTLTLALLLACASPLRGQMFVEGAGGSNVVMPEQAHGDFWSTGYNLRASVGRVVTPRVSVRLDAYSLFQFERKVEVRMYQPCATDFCSTVNYAFDEGRVVGAAANALFNIDARGIVYAIGGATLFRNNGLRLGVLAGAGIAVPVGPRLRAVAEARVLGPLSHRAAHHSIVPITIGFRY